MKYAGFGLVQRARHGEEGTATLRLLVLRAMYCFCINFCFGTSFGTETTMVSITKTVSFKRLFAVTGSSVALSISNLAELVDL